MNFKHEKLERKTPGTDGPHEDHIKKLKNKWNYYPITSHEIYALSDPVGSEYSESIPVVSLSDSDCRIRRDHYIIR
jgi:hypothetical protein